MVKVIGITGMPASGKTTVADSLKSKKVEVVHLGDFIWDYLKKNNIKRSQETGNMASLYFWAEYSDIPIARWAHKQIKNSEKDTVVIDGVRTVEELSYFNEEYGNDFKMIAVVASPHLRKKREEKRKRFDETKFEIRDKEELKIGVGEIIALSNYYIHGNRDKEGVKKEAGAVFKKIIGKKSL